MEAPEDISRRLAAALERIERLTRAQGQRTYQQLGLSPLQARALGALRAGGPSRVGRLARELLVTNGTLSEAVRVLEEKGLVRRGPDPDEHRAVQVKLTPKGRGLSQRAERWPDELFGPVLEAMGAHEAGKVLGSLLRLLQGLERAGFVDTHRMCANCDFFRPGQGDAERPHYCALLESAIGAADLQVDCPDFRLAPEETREARWESLASPD